MRNGSPGANGHPPTDPGKHRRDRGPRGRETAAAESSSRRTWYGYGQLTRSEKDGYGVFLHDTVRIFGEVSVLGLPALLAVAVYPATAFLDVTATALLAWLSMTVTGTLVRGGWVHPVGTDTPGWVTLAPTLLLLRIGYFNATLLLAGFGGIALAGLTSGSLGLLFAVATGALAMLTFPAVADRWLELFAR